MMRWHMTTKPAVVHVHIEQHGRDYRATYEHEPESRRMRQIQGLGLMPPFLHCDTFEQGATLALHALIDRARRDTPEAA